MMNNVKNQLTGQYGPVPDTGRFYKVGMRCMQSACKIQALWCVCVCVCVCVRACARACVLLANASIPLSYNFIGEF